MSAIGEVGFVFGFDLGIAFVAVLLMLSLMLAHFGFEREQAVGAFGEISLQRKAVFLIDSMAKNRDEGQPLLGSALFDEDKRRVLQNEIDLALLGKASGFRKGRFFVSQVSVSGKNLFFEEGGDSCVSLDRIVSVDGRLENLVVVACED